MKREKKKRKEEKKKRRKEEKKKRRKEEKENIDMDFSRLGFSSREILSARSGSRDLSRNVSYYRIG